VAGNQRPKNDLGQVGELPLRPGAVGGPYEDWAVNDPARQPVEKVHAIRDDIDHGVCKLVTEILPTSM
jgi:hypothetical protein